MLLLKQNVKLSYKQVNCELCSLPSYRIYKTTFQPTMRKQRGKIFFPLTQALSAIGSKTCSLF
jgi:hypothetical protein